MRKKTNNPQFDEVFYFEVGVEPGEPSKPPGLWREVPVVWRGWPTAADPPSLGRELLALPGLARSGAAAACCCPVLRTGLSLAVWFRGFLFFWLFRPNFPPQGEACFAGNMRV